MQPTLIIALLSALFVATHIGIGYRHWAIYVKPVRSITPGYMALIDPFRRWIVYPQILHKVREHWIKLYAEPSEAPE